MQELIAKPISDMERLAIAQNNIAALKGELKEWQSEYDACLERILSCAVFTPDKFLVAIKRKGDSYREGDLKLLRKPVTRRTVRRADFVAAYPDLFLRIGNIPLKEAEAALGKTALDALCDTQTSFSYEIVDMEVA